MEQEEKLRFKQLLKSKGIDLLKERLKEAEMAMEQAQDAANNESKSSAGDKYETGRSMGQLAKEMNAHQANEAKRELQFLQAIPADKICETFVNGAIAKCNGHYYFLSSGLGVIHIEDQKIIFLSPRAPLGLLMIQKKAGDKFLFNNCELFISELF